MNAAPRFILAALLVPALGCGAAKKNSTPKARPATANDLQGRWRVETIDGNLPSQHNLESMILEFKTNGRWTYTGISASGQVASGTGRWSLSDSTLTCKTDKFSGESTATLEGDQLVFDSDPVIMMGKKGLPSRYIRHK